MNMRKRRDMQLAYIADEAAMEEMLKCRQILQKLNFADRSDFDGVTSIVKELLGKSEGACINPPFYCDYGSHIEVGKNFFANYNCTIIDVAKVKIGDNCMLAPNVAKLATTSSTGGLSLALQRAIVTARPKGRYRKHFYWPAIKRYYWNLLFSIPLLAHLYISELLHLLYCRLFQHNIL